MIRPVETAPYSALATVYDVMMDHVEYSEWAGYIRDIFSKHARRVHRVCELACGTGSISIALSQMGFDMTCSDRSKAMIDRALSKSRAANAAIVFSVCDMMAFRSRQPFDAVLCLYDSVNYLMNEKDVGRWLKGCSGLLTAGGLLVFDSCTEANSLSHFDGHFESNWEHRYIRRSRYVRDERIQINEVEITVGDTRYLEIHQQRIYPLATIAGIVETSDFRPLAIYADLSFRRGGEQSERVHWVLQKKDAA